jgi:dephospho-CoA kinase
MKLWIVTGGIGTGKSQVRQFLTHGRPGWFDFSSDESVRRAYLDSEVQQRIGTRFQLELPAEGPTADQRAELRQRIAASPLEKQALESILHPWVFNELETARQAAVREQGKVLVAEVPLYYETLGAVIADCVIAVAATKASQVKRLQSNRGLSEAVIEGMLGIQMPIESKMARADVVIWNDGSLGALERQTRLLAEQLSSQ